MSKLELKDQHRETLKLLAKELKLCPIAEKSINGSETMSDIVQSMRYNNETIARKIGIDVDEIEAKAIEDIDLEALPLPKIVEWIEECAYWKDIMVIMAACFKDLLPGHPWSIADEARVNWLIQNWEKVPQGSEFGDIHLNQLKLEVAS